MPQLLQIYKELEHVGTFKASLALTLKQTARALEPVKTVRLCSRS